MIAYEQVAAMRCLDLDQRQGEIQCVTTVFDPATTRLALSAQPEFNRSPGIVRGCAHPETGQVTDYLTDGHGKPLSGNQAREGIWTFEDHIRALDQNPAQSGRDPIAFVGAGNTLMNRRFVGYIEDSGNLQQGAQYVSGEGTWWDGNEPWAGRTYHSLVVRQNEEVSIEELRYSRLTSGPSPGKLAVTSIENPGSHTSIKYALAGQRIVKNGTAIDFGRLKEMAKDGQFYDLNHVLQFPWIKTQPNPEWGDLWAGLLVLGYRHFFEDPDGRRWLNRDLLGMAMDGQAVLLRADAEVWRAQFNYPTRAEFLSQLSGAADPGKFQGFLWRGYRECQGPPPELGYYELGPDSIAVRFLPGVYSHNVLGITRDGLLMSVQLRSLSLRCGVTILGLARLVASLRVIGGPLGEVVSRGGGGDPVQDAVLLDNGGDVVLCYTTSGALSVANYPAAMFRKYERDKLRGCLFFLQDRDKPATGRRSPSTRPLESFLPGEWNTSGQMQCYGVADPRGLWGRQA